MHGFSDVDASGQGVALLKHLDGVADLPAFTALREYTHTLVPPGPGVDVGCGVGRAVAELQARGRQAIGVDRSTALIEEARRRYPECRFEVGDALRLPLPDGSQAWYRAERVYQHLDDPAAALAEARRVLAPDGLLITATGDANGFLCGSANTRVNRAMFAAFADDLASGSVATRMPVLAAAAGFGDIHVHPLASAHTDLATIGPLLLEVCASAALRRGTVTRREADSWWEELRQQDRDGTLLVVITMLVTTARRLP